MNAEKLHMVALAVLDNFKKTNIEPVINTVIQSLQNQINQPAQPQHQQQLSSGIQSLYNALDSAPDKEFSPTWKLIIEEIGGGGFISTELKMKIQKTFEQNQITPSLALEGMQAISTELNKFKTALEQIISGFQFLKIGKEELNEGECALGVLVPRDSVKNKLHDLGKELIDLDKMFAPFSELIEGNRSGYEIRSVSSSEFQLYLSLLPGVALCIAKTVDIIITSYTKLIAIREYRTKLQKEGLSEKDLGGIKGYADKLMEDTIKTIVEDLLKDHEDKKDKARLNELSTELKHSLNKIANRIDRGFNIEIKVGPLQNTGQEGTEGSSITERNKKLESIKLIAKHLGFLKPAGDSILSLPESSSESETDKQKKKS